MQTWTVRELERGRTALEYFTGAGVRLRLVVYDGGGFVTSHGAWYFGARTIAIIVAGEA